MTYTTNWYTPISSSEAIKVIRTHKGKAFVTIACSEYKIAIEKADLIASLQTDVENGDWSKWCLYITDWGMYINAHKD